MKNKFKLAAVCSLLLLALLALFSCQTVAEPEGAWCECDPETGKCQCTEDEPQGTVGNDNLYIPGVGDNDIPVVELSASTRGILSTVAIRATIKIEYSYGYDFDSDVRDVTKASSGIIYQLERDKGNAYILTNYHALHHGDGVDENGRAHTIKLYLYGQESEQYAIDATYVGGSMLYDFAVLRVEGSEVLKNSHAIPATFADSEEVEVLDWAIAVGDPEGLGMSVTSGMICVDSEMLDMTGADGRTRITVRVMRIDVAINEGNSGGGLYNENGLLIGMVNAKRTGAEVDNIAYAFPSNLVKLLADNVIYHCAGTENINLVTYPLGFEMIAGDMWIEIDGDTGRIIKRESIVVDKISSGKPADGALQVGDVIKKVTVDGLSIDVTRMYHVTDTVLSLRPGSEIVFSVERINADGLTESLDIKLSVTEDMASVSK